MNVARHAVFPARLPLPHHHRSPTAMPAKRGRQLQCLKKQAGSCNASKSRQATAMPAKTGNCNARRDAGTELISAHLQETLGRSCNQHTTVIQSFGQDPSFWLYGVASYSCEQESVTPIPVLAQLSQKLTDLQTWHASYTLAQAATA